MKVNDKFKVIKTLLFSHLFLAFKYYIQININLVFILIY